MANEHPEHLLGRLGISDAPAGTAVSVLAILQYLFLAQVWIGYPVRWAGRAIDPFIVFAGLALSAVGVGAIVARALIVWHRGDRASARLERPALNASFAPMRIALERVAARSSLDPDGRRPELLYTPRNALALEARETPERNAVVVGLEQRGRMSEDPETFGALLGHETSHLEVRGTRRERTARRLAFLHLRAIAWLCFVLTVVLGYIDRSGVEPTGVRAVLHPTFDASIYIVLSSQLSVLVLSSAIILVHAYFFVVRREHMHDLRGSQLGATDALDRRLFGPMATARGRAAVTDFMALHPSAAARARVLRQRDFIILSAALYPLIVSGIQPLAQLLTAGWRQFLGVEPSTWNGVLTLVTGLLLYLVLRADVVRLGLGLLLTPRRSLRSLLVYAAVAGVATQAPRFVLEILYGLRKGVPWGRIGTRILDGFVSGGSNVALLVGAVLIVLAYLSGVRIAAQGEGAARPPWIEWPLAAIVSIGGFAISSLTTAAYRLHVATLLLAVTLVYVLVCTIGRTCTSCAAGLFLQPLLLRTRCRCGHDRLRLLRRWTTRPFPEHILQETPERRQ